MLTTKHAGQTLWHNKNDTEDLWMPMVKHTAADHYHSKLLTGEKFLSFSTHQCTDPICGKAHQNVCQRTVSEMITYRQVNNKAKTSSPILIGADKSQKMIPSTPHPTHT